MFSNMAASLIKHELIQHDPAEGQGTAPRRRAADHARPRSTASPTAASRSRVCATRKPWALFTTLGRATARVRAATCVLKCGFRAGDNAPMAYVELVDRPQASVRSRK